MNREIKFRGKTLDYAPDIMPRWAYGLYYQEMHGGETHHLITDRSLTFEVAPDTIGQFTGLYDADGNEIYEGDIFQVKAYEPKFEVYFEDGAFEYRQIDSSSKPFRLRRVCSDAYVLGNIHDNPDLLEGGDQ